MTPANGANSGVAVRIGRTTVAEVNGGREAAQSGSWAGSVRVRPGEESNASLTASMFALGEVVLYGELVDDDGR